MSGRNKIKMHLYSIINAYPSVSIGNTSTTHSVTQSRLQFGFELRQNMFTVCFFTTHGLETSHYDLV